MVHLVLPSIVFFGFGQLIFSYYTFVFLSLFRPILKVLHKHACFLAWLSSSVVLMLWASLLFCCCTLMFPRLTLYVFFVVMVRLHCILRRISLPCRASWMVCMVYFGLPSAVDACSWRLAWPKQEQNMMSVNVLAFIDLIFGAP